MAAAQMVGALTLATSFLAGCESPTQPDPRVPPATGSPTQLAVSQWRFGAQITSIRVEATWGTLYSTSQDVTSGASWQSSNPAIVRVIRPGQVESVSPGDTTLTITYRDVSISHLMRVFTGESPLTVLTPDTTTYVGSTVRDARSPTGAGIEGVSVEILAGHNAGRTATTDRIGFYRFSPPFICGPITVRASKSGFHDRVGSSVMCENGMPDLMLTPSQ